MPTAGKLTAPDAKGRASEGQPIQVQPDCKQNNYCSMYSVSPAIAYQLEGTINQIPTKFVLDMGAAVTLLSHDHWIGLGTSLLKPWDGANLVGANGSPITVHGTVDAILRFAGINFPTHVVVVDGLTAAAILGLDFLEAHECIVNIKKKLLVLPKYDVSLPLERTNSGGIMEHPSTATARIQHTQHVPARSEVEVMAQMDDFISGGEWIIEQDPKRPLPVMVARAVITPQQGQFPVRILNDNINLYQGTKLAVTERLDQDSVGIKAVSPAEHTYLK